MATREAGLSPPARGNLAEVDILVFCVGSIPACAGEPAGICFCSISLRVYPRLRGGTQQSLQLLGGSVGLSPPARGNPTALANSRCLVGSIPACAGEPQIG